MKKIKWLKIVAITLGIIGVGLVMSITPTTFSYLTSADAITNPLNLGNVDIEVDEDFVVPTDWDGGSYDKVVRVQNLGVEQSLIRIAIVPRWVEADGVTPFAGDTSMIELIWENHSLTPGWIDGGDGYYYYTATVASGASTLPIMSSVSFDTSGLSENILQRYENKKLIIDVQAEAVLAQELAYENVWSQMANSSSTTDTMLRNLITTP